MLLETLLNMIAIPLIVVASFLHILVIRPKLQAMGEDARSSDDWTVHRDWRIYKNAGGSSTVYRSLWTSYIISLTAVCLQGLQFFFFPGITL